ncbi:hypothetical protein SLEP1_g52280 [Rubroshorea leprosula]|uniref:Uncharacterized protein n=1 Tax=Rubroshorea leprosula TaxID=152421 RepID=A0AAV5M5W7_9ROSI|nr:hypothetical protein SLEP1_g52280 [Rubroshorea leprosula]
MARCRGHDCWRRVQACKQRGFGAAGGKGIWCRGRLAQCRGEIDADSVQSRCRSDDCVGSGRRRHVGRRAGSKGAGWCRGEARTCRGPGFGPQGAGRRA